MNLGRLERVMNLREAWADEARSFTPWLAQSENLQQLGDALNISLELQGVEQWVGPFRADILARSVDTDGVVLIENQLEKTDHCHLGQIITYAAGLEANTVVWIAEGFTAEHRAAIDWLNKHTSEELQFFGVQIEVWKIGTSDIAPKFEVVAKPNAWVRAIAHSSQRRGNIEEQIRALLIAEPGLSGRAIASKIGCSPTTASRWKGIVEGNEQSAVNE